MNCINNVKYWYSLKSIFTWTCISMIQKCPCLWCMNLSVRVRLGLSSPRLRPLPIPHWGWQWLCIWPSSSKCGHTLLVHLSVWIRQALWQPTNSYSAPNALRMISSCTRGWSGDSNWTNEPFEQRGAVNQGIVSQGRLFSAVRGCLQLGGTTAKP